MNRSEPTGTDRLLFFDGVRNIAMLSVVFYHAVAAYSTITPHWSVHDGVSVTADGIRRLFDIFMMPVFFFVAGYFALSSLSRQGTWGFLKGKAKRIGVPWLLAILIIVPLADYGGKVKTASGASVPPFLHYWASYLSGIGTTHVGLWEAGRTNQMHFWFLSLLLTFFIGLVLLRIGRQAANNGSDRLATTAPASLAPATAASILKSLAAATAVTWFGCYAALLAAPDMSWVTVDLLWQFQLTGIASYVACFVLGSIACARQWFAGNAFPDRLLAWLGTCLFLTVVFFILGREIFAHPLASNASRAGLLLAYSFIRAMLCMSLVVLIIAYARRYWNRPSRLNAKLSNNSYNIYLVHIFFVTFFQDVLMIWPSGPARVKAVIISVVVLPISYGISRVIDRFPHWVIAFFVLLFALAAIAH